MDVMAFMEADISWDLIEVLLPLASRLPWLVVFRPTLTVTATTNAINSNDEMPIMASLFFELLDSPYAIYNFINYTR